MGLRIAIVTESFLPSTNGVTNSVVRITESLWNEGHEVLIIAPTAPSSTFMGFPVIRTTRFKLKQFPVGLPLLNLTSILRSFKPDLIHVAAPFVLGNQALSVGRRLGIPTVAVYQTDVAGYMHRYKLAVLNPLVSYLVSRIHRKATLNLVPNREAGSYLAKHKVKAVEQWGRGVDLDLFHPAKKNNDEVRRLRKLIAPNGELVIGFVGRLAAEKQVERYLEFLDLPNIAVAIVGEGPERSILQTKFADYPVKFLGKLQGSALADAYAAMDVFVHCGTEETFGQTIQEAQASGLAVIAPNRGGPKFLIDSGINGLLVNPDTANAYRSAIQKLIKKPQLREALSVNGRNAVLGKSWKANNQVLLQHYKKLTDGAI